MFSRAYVAKLFFQGGKFLQKEPPQSSCDTPLPGFEETPCNFPLDETGPLVSVFALPNAFSSTRKVAFDGWLFC